jgi:hypothetical protein
MAKIAVLCPTQLVNPAGSLGAAPRIIKQEAWLTRKSLYAQAKWFLLIELTSSSNKFFQAQLVLMLLENAGGMVVPL